MAQKKSSAKQKQVLSPENYIRKKARNLPIDKCYINSRWKQEGMAQIIVARKHSNGNYTHGFYLVDLLCLGVRDTFYYYNSSDDELKSLINEMSFGVKMIEVDYTLVHNIIYAAIEYADALGFKPHKVFNTTSRFILEEDTEDVELIDVECGLKGKPTFVRPHSFADAQANSIINQLNKSVGAGNFDVIIPGTYNDDEKYDDLEDEGWTDVWDDDADEEWNDDDDDDENDEPNPRFQHFLKYETMTPLARKALFLNLTKKDIKTLEAEELKELYIVTESIYLNDVAVDEQVDYYYDQWSEEVEMEILTDEYTPEILGVDPLKFSGSELNELSQDINKLKAKKKLLKKDVGSLLKKWGKVPLLRYYELLVTSEKEHEQQLLSLLSSSPNYPLFRLELLEGLMNSNVEVQTPLFGDVFENRSAVLDVEMRMFLQLKIIAMAIDKDDADLFDKLEAQSLVVEELDLPDEDLEMVNGLLLMVKITVLSNFFASENMDKTSTPNSLQQTATKKTSTTNNPQQTATKKASTSKNDECATTLQFSIKLKYLDSPSVWRQLQMPADATFDEFHCAIQLAFGWENEHLYMFSPKGYASSPIIEIPFEEYDSPFSQNKIVRLDAKTLTLSEIFTEEGQTYTYIYDLGDSWEHLITLEEILPISIQTPSLIDGSGACPPENCGGPGGYEDILDILENKKHPEYSETRSWLGLKRGEQWNPHLFDLLKTRELF
jgi:hypothetical protein